MILRLLRLQDFGLYAGVVEFDLAPRNRGRAVRPIVLIGGKNGAGKTSLLEAVRLVLYGRLALGSRVSQAEYDAYLRSKVHRPRHGEASPAFASVLLEFDYAEAGQIHRYRVCRSWVVRGQSVVESLEITKDGQTISGVPREEWHHFLQELLPPGVSQLFFFDGEKIKEIAEDSEDDDQLARAVRSLLGIDLIGKLRTDLGLYTSRHEQGESSTDARLDEVVRDLERMERGIAEATDALAGLNTRAESLARAAEAAQRRFSHQGGDVALNRGRLEAERSLLQERAAQIEGKLRQMSGADLPLSVAPKLLTRVNAKLSEEQREAPRGSALAKHLRNALAQWKPRAPDRWTKAHWQDLDAFVDDLAKPEATTGASSTALREIGSIPGALEVLKTARGATAQGALELANELAEIADRRQEIEVAFARVDATTTDHFLNELRDAEQAVGVARAERKAKVAEVQDLVYRRTVLARERGRILSEQAGLGRVLRGTNLAARVSQVLALYEQRLIEQKVNQLKKTFVDCFRRLARKGDLVSSVEIDPVTFQVTLLGAEGRRVEKQALSAGEKQIYAIAMLWSLAKTSGRALPMIIDTPLGRLDSDHRNSILQRYLPEASHQVLVLATDTEIDADTFFALEPNVSHAYLLDYVSAEGRSVALPGYFQDLKAEFGGRRALQQA